MYAESTTTQGLLFVPVFIVNTDQTTGEGEDFAKSDENRVMDLCQWWAEEARGEHYAPEGAQCQCSEELQAFHNYASSSSRTRCHTNW